jgi:hypothetical protein
MSVHFTGKMLLVALAAISVCGSVPVRGADEPKVVKLPAAVLRTVVAADGRYLVMHLPKAKQIAVFDVKEEKIAKLLPAPDDDILLAGALDYIFVVRKSNSTMQRWNLATFEKEATVRLTVAEGPFENVCMGCAANGPMLLSPKHSATDSTKLVLINPVTVREVPTAGWLPSTGYNTIHASPDGQVFAWPSGSGGTFVARSVDGKFSAKGLVGKGSGLKPGPGGRFFYSGNQVYDEEGRLLHPPSGTPTRNGSTSAVQGPIFVELEWIPVAPKTGPQGFRKAHVFVEGQFKPVATIEGIDKFKTASSHPFLIPRFNRLIFFGKDADELILFPFDLDALLAKSEADYLVVLSDPPREIVAGKTFEYQPVVKSKKGGVKVKLDAGPDGMKLGADGKLIWEVPPDMARQEVVVILSVSDSGGQDLFHTFRFNVVAPVKKP